MTTFVLIHGAYQGGWVWQRVTTRLVAAGHTVFAPSLDGCAERRHAVRPGINTETHGAEIAELLFFEDLRDVVLVGTSSGGMVLCASAERARERIARLVFADALALFDGERIPDIVNRASAVTTELTTGPSREDAAGRMFASLE
jgi:pimeloyl-ACP methyl ester carboxylesterase